MTSAATRTRGRSRTQRQRRSSRTGRPPLACPRRESNGGFGAYLQLNHDWANPARKANSYELFARHVMPEFQGQAYSTREAAARASAARPELVQSNLDAVAAATARYAGETGQS